VRTPFVLHSENPPAKAVGRGNTISSLFKSVVDANQDFGEDRPRQRFDLSPALLGHRPASSGGFRVSGSSPNQRFKADSRKRFASTRARRNEAHSRISRVAPGQRPTARLFSARPPCDCSAWSRVWGNCWVGADVVHRKGPLRPRHNQTKGGRYDPQYCSNLGHRARHGHSVSLSPLSASADTSTSPAATPTPAPASSAATPSLSEPASTPGWAESGPGSPTVAQRPAVRQYPHHYVPTPHGRTVIATIATTPWRAPRPEWPAASPTWVRLPPIRFTASRTTGPAESACPIAFQQTALKPRL
jgi:hypothetical protein